MKGKVVKDKICKVIYPIQFHSDLLVCATPVYEDSFRDILERSGRKYQIIKMLEQRFKYLCDKNHKQHCRSGWIEKLSYEKNMYAIRIKDNNLNIRILFVFYTHAGKTHIVLLKAFLEKNDGPSKTNSYKREIKLLQPILDHLEEMFKNGIQTD